MCSSSIVISPDESQGHTGFISVTPLPYILTSMHDNSKMVSWI